MYFSILFKDSELAKGNAVKFLCNNEDLTNAPKEKIIDSLSNGENHIDITTKNFNFNFSVDQVCGFTV